MIEIVLEGRLEPIFLVQDRESMLKLYERLVPGEDKAYDLSGEYPDGTPYSVKFNSDVCVSISLRDANTVDQLEDIRSEQQRLLDSTKR